MFNHARKHPEGSVASSQAGIINFSALLYDQLVRWFVMGGKEQAFRKWTIETAEVQTGETVLDVGCGTGTLAIAAKERVGPTGRVFGIDPSKQLLSAARRKATHRGLEIDFRLAGIEQLPFADQSFDAVLSTFMMHHLPYDLKRQGLLEVARVLKPEGRLLVIDFKDSVEQPGRPSEIREGAHGLTGLPSLIEAAGISPIEMGEIPFRIRSVAGQRAGHKYYGFVLSRKKLESAKATIPQ